MIGVGGVLVGVWGGDCGLLEVWEVGWWNLGGRGGRHGGLAERGEGGGRGVTGGGGRVGGDGRGALVLDL